MMAEPCEANEDNTVITWSSDGTESEHVNFEFHGDFIVFEDGFFEPGETYTITVDVEYYDTYQSSDSIQIRISEDLDKEILPLELACLNCGEKFITSKDIHFIGKGITYDIEGMEILWEI